MMDITCDSCGKKYRIDETKMRKESAKVKCKACAHIMVITKPSAEPVPESVLEQIPDPVPETPISPEGQAPVSPPEMEVPQSVVDQPPPKPEEKPAEPEKDIPVYYSQERIRFGLFAKIIIVMLFISLVPFLSFWGLTWRETNERIRSDTGNLMAQTAKGMGNQVDSWVNNNVSILRTTARLPGIISMQRDLQEPILRTINDEYPWVYLVFTVGLDGMNVARSDDVPLKDYSDRQYYKDIIKGKNLSWQTSVGKTSKKPALVLAVPIKSDGQLVGVMAASMQVDQISQNIAMWKQGETGYAFLVDEKGFVIAHPIKQFVMTRKNLNSHPLIANFRQRGWTTITTQFDSSNGARSLGHVRSNNYGWALILQQETREVFEGLNRVQEFALILLGCTVLIVTIIAWLSARAIVTPIRKLTDAAERMSLGELNVKIDVKSRDEIGLLAQAVGRMQTSLRLAMNRLRRKR
jgi:methyl-accepting chemotaxis protein